jgi:Asp-tRNA(Asn)/Glu-tRNA(Gln) amidotransferase A subunit family amidase
LPLGLQVVGAYLNDNNTLKIARWCTDKIRFSIGWPA